MRNRNRTRHFRVVTGLGRLNNSCVCVQVAVCCSWADCNLAEYTWNFPLPESEREQDGEGVGTGVSVCFGPLVVSRWAGKRDVLDGTMLTLAQTIGHRYQMFNDAGSKRKRDNGKEPLALLCACVCVCFLVCLSLTFMLMLRFVKL